MDLITSILTVWILLATALLVYVLYRLTNPGIKHTDRHRLFPFISAEGGRFVPPKGAYFTWTLLIIWILALNFFVICEGLQAMGRAIPGPVNLAAFALLVTATGLLGIEIVWRNRDRL